MTDVDGNTNNTSLLSVSGFSRKRTFKGIQKSISETIKKVTKKPPHLDETCSTRSNEAVFRYGNYNRYYGYRNENHQEDQRLAVLKKEWFQNKSVLDVGSNVGHVSLWIGKHFNPSRIKGVDIDVELVKAAKKNIVHYIDEHYVTGLEHSYNNQEPCDEDVKTENKDVDGNVQADEESWSCSKKAKLDIDITMSDDTTRQNMVSCVTSTDEKGDVSSTAGDGETAKPPPPPRPPPPKCQTQGSVGLEKAIAEMDEKSISLHPKQENALSPEAEVLKTVEINVLETETKDKFDGSVGKVIETGDSTAAVTPLLETEEEETQGKVEPNRKKAVPEEEEKLTSGYRSEEEEEEDVKLLERVEKSKGNAVEGVFPYNVSFVLENYVPPAPQVLQYAKPEYDVILCLSVTKWVQLNFGDGGLKMMFEKMFKQLRPGGLLILEPQPYKSYKRRKNLTSAIRRNYDAMELMPDAYIEYLLSPEIGFATCEKIADDLHEKKGFKRPIYLLKKK